MKATIEWNGKKISGKNTTELYKQMNTMLRVDGPRSLKATTESGTEIFASLCHGEDYIRTVDGRNLLKD